MTLTLTLTLTLTNTAETSVTLPHVRVVIDPGQVKEKHYATDKGMEVRSVAPIEPQPPTPTPTPSLTPTPTLTLTAGALGGAHLAECRHPACGSRRAHRGGHGVAALLRGPAQEHARRARARDPQVRVRVGIRVRVRVRVRG